MEISYDHNKNARNIQLRGLSFDEACRFDFATAVIEVDERQDYGEKRMTAIGLLDGIPHVLVFTVRHDAIRVISLRKANKREIIRYEKTPRP